MNNPIIDGTVVSEFLAATGTFNPVVAFRFLELGGGNVNTAVEYYLQEQEHGPQASPAESETVVASSSSSAPNDEGSSPSPAAAAAAAGGKEAGSSDNDEVKLSAKEPPRSAEEQALKLAGLSIVVKQSFVMLGADRLDSLGYVNKELCLQIFGYSFGNRGGSSGENEHDEETGVADVLWSNLCHSMLPITTKIPADIIASLGGHRKFYHKYQGGPFGSDHEGRAMPPPSCAAKNIRMLVSLQYKGKPILMKKFVGDEEPLQSFLQRGQRFSYDVPTLDRIPMVGAPTQFLLEEECIASLHMRIHVLCTREQQHNSKTSLCPLHASNGYWDFDAQHDQNINRVQFQDTVNYRGHYGKIYVTLRASVLAGEIRSRIGEYFFLLPLIDLEKRQEVVVPESVGGNSSGETQDAFVITRFTMEPHAVAIDEDGFIQDRWGVRFPQNAVTMKHLFSELRSC